MTEQGALLKLMIKNEMKRHKGCDFSISNHSFDSPGLIKLLPDEVGFITFISINANSDFELNYYSAGEVRKIERTIPTPVIIEENIVTKHHSSLTFDMSNTDKYRVSLVKLKIIK